MQERDIIGHVRTISPKFKARIESLFEFDFIGNARAVGLIGAVEFAANCDQKEKFDPMHKIAVQAVATIQKHGVILRALPGDIIGFCPPLIISEAEIDDMFNRVEAALAEMYTFVKSLR